MLQRATPALLLSQADSSHQGCSQLCWTASGSGKCRCSQQACDPAFLMPLALHVFAESLIRLVVVIISNPPESVHFAPELCVLSLVQRRGALPIKNWRKELKLRYAPRADRLRSERRQRPRDLVVPLLLLQLGQFVVGPAQRPATRIHRRLGVFVRVACANVTVACSLPTACDEK